MSVLRSSSRLRAGALLPTQRFIPRLSGTFVAFWLSIVTLIALGFALAGAVPPNPSVVDAQTASQFMVAAAALHPKPRDRILFMALVLALPLVITLYVWLARRLKLNLSHDGGVVWCVIATAIFIIVTKGDALAVFSLFDKKSIVVTILMIILSASAFFLSSRYKIWASRLSTSLACAAALVPVVLFSIWTRKTVDYLPHFTSHYEAVIYSIVHVLGGGTCLADVIPQYGCYSEFMAPILRIVGASTFSLTMFLSILQYASLIAIIVFCRTIFSQGVILAAAVIWLMITISFTNLIFGVSDPYFAYSPIRFVFPAMSLLVVMWFQAKPTGLQAMCVGIFAAAALAWNLDSGLAVAISLAGFIALGRLTSASIKQRSYWTNAASHLLRYIAGMLIIACLFVLYLELKSDWKVDISNYILYQKLFYLSGFAMIPIPAFPDWWVIPAAIVGGLLTVTVARVFSSETARDERLERVSYLAVMAIGLALYWSGRSHWLVLRLVIWPEVIILFFLVDRARLQARSSISRFAVSSLTVLMLALPLAFAAMAGMGPRLLTIAEQRLSVGAEPTNVERDIAFVQSHVKKNERVVVFAPDQSTIYLETHTHPALGGPGLAEMLRRTDLDDEHDAVLRAGPATLFLRANIDQLGLGPLGFDMDALRKVYALAAWGPEGRIMYLHRKPFVGRDLFQIAEPGVTWSGVKPTFARGWDEGGLSEWGRPGFSPFDIPGGVRLGQSFTFRFHVEPSAKQVDFAALVSSHTTDFRGFAILHWPAIPDAYVAFMGDGSRFWMSAPFRIPAGKESEVIVNYNRQHLVVSVSGQIAVDATNLSLVPADTAVMIGNWQYGSREFSGKFSSVEYYDTAIF